jgi:hypothetical protein
MTFCTRGTATETGGAGAAGDAGLPHADREVTAAKEAVSKRSRRMCKSSIVRGRGKLGTAATESRGHQVMT